MAHSKLPRKNIIARCYIETTDGLTGFKRMPVYGEANSIVLAVCALGEQVNIHNGRVLTAPTVFHSKGFSRVQAQGTVLATARKLSLLPRSR